MDETGVASMEGLPLGKYYLTETKTADSYVLDSEPTHFELAYQNQDTEVIYAGIDVENVKEKVKVRIVKSDAETGEHLEGVTFVLYAKDNILNIKNEVILMFQRQLSLYQLKFGSGITILIQKIICN